MKINGVELTDKELDKFRKIRKINRDKFAISIYNLLQSFKPFLAVIITLMIVPIFIAAQYGVLTLMQKQVINSKTGIVFIVYLWAIFPFMIHDLVGYLLRVEFKKYKEVKQ